MPDKITVLKECFGQSAFREGQEQVVDAIKAKIDLDKIGDLLGGLGGLFGKK